MEFIALKKDTIVGFHISMTNVSNQYIKFYTRDDTIVFPLIDDRETVRQMLETFKEGSTNTAAPAPKCVYKLLTYQNEN